MSYKPRTLVWGRLTRLELIGIMNETIDQKTIETSQFYVCNFLQKKYNISKSDAEDT